MPYLKIKCPLHDGLKTAKIERGEITLHVTQQWSEVLQGGHYKYAIFNEKGDLLVVGNSIGGPPCETVEEISEELYKQFLHDMKWL